LLTLPTRSTYRWRASNMSKRIAGVVQWNGG
jgi:hypothetical protein